MRNELELAASDDGCFRCFEDGCECCKSLRETKEFTSFRTKNRFSIDERLTCQSERVVYIINCLLCDEQFVGCTENKMCDKFQIYLDQIREGGPEDVGKHFAEHNIDDLPNEWVEFILVRSVFKKRNLGKTKLKIKHLITNLGRSISAADVLIMGM